MNNLIEKLQAYGGDKADAADGYQFACLLMREAAARIAELEAALKKYSRHACTCEIYAQSNPADCTCGLRAILVSAVPKRGGA